MAWLQRTRTRSIDPTPVATFFQPYDNSGGPDILFALGVQNDQSSALETILCSIQLKSGLIKDCELDNAIATTDVYAIASNSQQQQEVSNELQNWDKIIRVLICTWRDEDLPKTKLQKPQRFSSRNLSAPQNLNQSLPKEYFLFCPRADTDSLLGSEFADISALMRLRDS